MRKSLFEKENVVCPITEFVKLELSKGTKNFVLMSEIDSGAIFSAMCINFCCTIPEFHL
jgi:hypothetical protein